MQKGFAILKERDKLMAIARDFNCELQEKQYLRQYTTIGIGGIAPFILYPVEEKNIEALLAALKEEKLNWRTLGAGSNLLVADKGVDEIILCLSKVSAKSQFEGESARVPGGMLLAKFIREAARRGLGGAECLSGIPGSIGGAIKMNAGSYGGAISAIVAQVQLITAGGRREVKEAKKLNFDYRCSAIKKHDVVLGAHFRLEKKEPKDIEKELEFYLNKRKESQPIGEKSAGCIFKNPPGLSAGQLIESLGLKGMSSGGAVISEKHANYIINRNNATFTDVLRLIDLIKDKAQKLMGIELKEEVEIWN
jgi:UDP-N-acetylmuramate dehydrogenase